MSNSSSLYFGHIEEKYDTDAITFEELDHSHPRGIITLYNGFNPVTKKDHEISYFNTKSIVDMVSHSKTFNPTTRVQFNLNQLSRIEWYNKCLTLFPDVKSEDVEDHTKLIYNWLISPLEEGVNTYMARYFVTYDQIIDYFGFKEIDSREKAEEYFRTHADKNWLIRKSSVTDTKYNQFFVIMTRTSAGFNNYLYVHRQGYGICGADATRHSDISTVELSDFEYYTNIVDLLISLNKCGTIEL